MSGDAGDAREEDEDRGAVLGAQDRAEDPVTQGPPLDGPLAGEGTLADEPLASDPEDSTAERP